MYVQNAGGIRSQWLALTISYMYMQHEVLLWNHSCDYLLQVISSGNSFRSMWTHFEGLGSYFDFLQFFDMSFQKKGKKVTFLKSEKRKMRILEHWSTASQYIKLTIIKANAFAR